MVKLIKINNEEDSGFFTNQFQEIITFEAESQVALVNSTFSIGLNNIVIDNNNNSLNFKRKGTEAAIDVSLALGNYTQSNFISEMRSKINSAQTLLTTGATPLGFDINPSVDTDGNFTITIGKTDDTKINDTNTHPKTWHLQA